jgi:hypothetical protein
VRDAARFDWTAISARAGLLAAIPVVRFSPSAALPGARWRG